MSSLGQMVAGIAHEINNPVNFIYGNLSHLDASVQDVLDIIEHYQAAYPDPIETVAEMIENVELDYLRQDIPKQIQSMRLGADRIRQLVLSLRNFSRLDEAEVKNVDLHEGIESTLTILSHRFKGDIGIIRHYGDLPTVSCSPAQINQVWMNLLVNACDALEEVKPRFLGTISKPSVMIETQNMGEKNVMIKIRDNGAGIPENILNTVFDPFFTTKPIGQGTGLGLSICYAIVERHRGKIQVRSQPDLGTEFSVILPISVNT
jgi:signal transduction histidine kinase